MRTIAETLEQYQNHLAENRSASTARSYKNALRAFRRELTAQGIEVDQTPSAEISDAWIGLFRQSLGELSGSTRKIYLTAVIGWYRFLGKELGLSVDLEQVRHMARPSIRPGAADDPPDEVDRLVRPVLDHVQAMAELPARNLREKLRRQRDSAFLLILADSGLSVEAMCGLRRADVDWSERRVRSDARSGAAVPVPLSNRALAALRSYLDMRLGLDDATGKPAQTLPVFARHDRGAGERVLPLSAASGRQLLRTHAVQALGDLGGEAGQPEIFYRYFIQRSIQSALGVLHPTIVSNCRQLFETGRYRQAVDAAIKTVEREVQSASGVEPSVRGHTLVSRAMEGSSAPLSFSLEPVRQQGRAGLFHGFFELAGSAGRSPAGANPVRIFEALVVASLCLNLLSDPA